MMFADRNDRDTIFDKFGMWWYFHFNRKWVEYKRKRVHQEWGGTYLKRLMGRWKRAVKRFKKYRRKLWKK